MPESNFRPARLPAQSKAAVPARASEILRQSRALLLGRKCKPVKAFRHVGTEPVEILGHGPNYQLPGRSAAKVAIFECPAQFLGRLCLH